jgi:hypothetical protein
MTIRVEKRCTAWELSCMWQKLLKKDSKHKQYTVTVFIFWVRNQLHYMAETCSQILSPWLGKIADSGIRLSNRPASLCSLAGRYDKTSHLHTPVRDLEFGLWWCAQREGERLESWPKQDFKEWVNDVAGGHTVSFKVFTFNRQDLKF